MGGRAGPVMTLLCVCIGDRIDDAGGVFAQVDAQPAGGGRQVIDEFADFVHVPGLVLGA